MDEDEMDEIMRHIDAITADHLGTAEEENIIPDPEEDDDKFDKVRGMIGTYNNEGLL